MARSRHHATATLVAALAVSAPTAASAKQPEFTTPNCFGQSASEIARGQFDGITNMGTHASNQLSPRLGIKNTARAFNLEHQSDLAFVLGGDQAICAAVGD